MSNLMEKQRGSWSGKFGFIMAAVGSAVGLGNIWRFPYVVGQYGGALFLLVYIAIIVLLGFPLLSLELSIGRHKQCSVISGAFKRDVKRGNWNFIGWLTIITTFLIVSYYSVIGGWIVKYLSSYTAGGGFVSGGNYGNVFNSFISSKWLPMLFNGIFLTVCLVVLGFGVKKGIEKISKILMPALFIMLIFVAIVSCTLPGAIEGIKFFLVPDFNRVALNGGFFAMLEAAMGQAFFSLSLGMGITVTYGSYLKRNSNIPKDSLTICAFDSIVATLAGFAVLPAIFATDPSLVAEGAGLLFISLPKVFSSLGLFGSVLAVIFFLLVLFAALTSAVSILEVLISSLKERAKKLSRPVATVIVGVAVAISSTIVSLSQSGMFGIDLLELFDMITVKILLPVTAFLICLFTILIYKPENAVKELRFDNPNPAKWVGWWKASVKFICPTLILIILAMGFIGLDLSNLII